MNNLNGAFLEEFKRIDKLCREIYRSEKGVTSYIENMTRISPYESKNIPNWNIDLQRLKELRHLRNRLSHEIGTLDLNMCSQHDIDWIKIFYNRILNQSDPIALLYKNRKENAAQKKYSSKQQTACSDSKHIRRKPPAAVIFFLIAVILTLLTVFIIINLQTDKSSGKIYFYSIISFYYLYYSL